MKFYETHSSNVGLKRPTEPSHMTKDDIFKKFWDDLADDWQALESAMNENNPPEKPPRPH